ncbi:tfbm-1 [Pristionchus pacificus]|nr:tfbm-1 [Pristionchus pacificus]
MPPRLPPLPALRDFIHLYKLRAKKILSQNFLMDMNITRKIVRAAGVRDGDWVCEVGPGPGGITRGILEAGASRVDVIEIDHRFIPALQHLSEAAEGRLHIHRADVLKTCVGEVWRENGFPSASHWLDDRAPPAHVIGNLPFNIASPLIIKYLREMSNRAGPWTCGRVPLTLTFQLEVARRLCSPIDNESRSRISIMAQMYTDPRLVFVIPGACFVPPPKVDVGVVRFVPRAVPAASSPFEVVEKLVRQVFHYRQKYVLKGLKTLYPEEIAEDRAHELLREVRVSPSTTSIRLGVEEYAAMAAVYERQCREVPGLFLYDYTKKKITLDSLASLPNAVPAPYAYAHCSIMPSEGMRLRDFSV